MTLGSGYLSAYFNGQAGMLFGNRYGCNVSNWFGGYNSVQTNVWGEVAGLFTAQALQITPFIVAACKANKQASVPTETAASYDSKISAKKSEITTALSGLKLNAEEAIKKGDSLTAAELVPTSYTDAVTNTEKTYNEAKDRTKAAKEKRNADYYEKQAIASATPGEKYTAEQIGKAKAEVAAIDQEIEDAEAAEAEAKKKYDAAVNAKEDKEKAIEAKLPNIKKLIGEYNDLVAKRNELATAEEKTETARMNKEVNSQKHYKPEEYTKVWQENEVNFGTGTETNLDESDLRKAYSTAIQNFISAEGNNKALWAHRAVALLDSNKIDMTKLNSSQRAMIEQVRNYAKDNKYEKPQPETPAGETSADNQGSAVA